MPAEACIYAFYTILPAMLFMYFFFLLKRKENFDNDSSEFENRQDNKQKGDKVFCRRKICFESGGMERNTRAKQD